MQRSVFLARTPAPRSDHRTGACFRFSRQTDAIHLRWGTTDKACLSCGCARPCRARRPGWPRLGRAGRSCDRHLVAVRQADQRSDAAPSGAATFHGAGPAAVARRGLPRALHPPPDLSPSTSCRATAADGEGGVDQPPPPPPPPVPGPPRLPSLFGVFQWMMPSSGGRSVVVGGRRDENGGAAMAPRGEVLLARWRRAKASVLQKPASATTNHLTAAPLIVDPPRAELRHTAATAVRRLAHPPAAATCSGLLRPIGRRAVSMPR